MRERTRTQKADETFEVRVSDSSLVNAGINKGAAVRFHRSATFWDGDLIAVRVPFGLRVAYAYHETGGRVRLEGRHPRCPVRTYQRRKVKVLGVACAAVDMSDSPDDSADHDAEELEWPEYIGGAA